MTRESSHARAWALFPAPVKATGRAEGGTEPRGTGRRTEPRGSAEGSADGTKPSERPEAGTKPRVEPDRVTRSGLAETVTSRLSFCLFLHPFLSPFLSPFHSLSSCFFLHIPRRLQSCVLYLSLLFPANPSLLSRLFLRRSPPPPSPPSPFQVLSTAISASSSSPLEPHVGRSPHFDPHRIELDLVPSVVSYPFNSIPQFHSILSIPSPPILPRASSTGPGPAALTTPGPLDPSTFFPKVRRSGQVKCSIPSIPIPSIPIHPSRPYLSLFLSFRSYNKS